MTKREEEPTVDARISEFAQIISPPEDGEAPVVVGGHAVNLWSEYYFALGVKALAAYMPFTSKDLDLIGPAGLLERLHATHKGKLTLSDPRSPVLGRLDILRENGSLLRIEVLHGVKGLNTKDLSRTMELRIEGISARVLMPHLILKAKIENAETISQKGRNDVKHVLMMILCARSFIEEFAGYVGAGQASSRALVNLLGEVMEIVSSRHAMKSTELWGFEFKEVWPLGVLKGLKDEKTSRWLEHRFP